MDEQQQSVADLAEQQNQQQPPAEPNDPPANASPDEPPARDWIVEGLADEFHGETAAETVGKMQARLSELGEQVSQIGTVPEDAAGYDYAPSDDVARVMGGADGPLMPMVYDAAREAGVTTEQFPKFMDAFVSKLFEGGHVIDPMKEARAIMGDGFTGSEDALAEAAGKKFDEMNIFVDNIAKQAGIDEAGVLRLKAMMDVADGFKALEGMRGLLSQRGIQTGGESVANTVSDAELEERMADPRADYRDPKYDKDWVEQNITSVYKKKYGSS